MVAFGLWGCGGGGSPEHFKYTLKVKRRSDDNAMIIRKADLQITLINNNSFSCLF